MVMRGHFDGRNVVIDGEVPKDLAVNARVTIVVEQDQPAAAAAEEPTVLQRIALLAVSANLPPDLSAQHDHYLYGTPKRK